MRLRPTTALVGLAVLGAVVTNPMSAGAAQSAKQLVTNAIAATKSASAVHIQGSVSMSNETVALDVQASNSSSGQGSVTINGANVQIVQIGSRVYFNADAAFWKMEAGASAAQLAGKWIYTSASGSDGKDFSMFINCSALLKQLLSGSKVKGSTFTLGKNTTVNGVPVYAVSGLDASAGTGGTAYIARSGKPYLIELKTSGSGGAGEITFSAYNQVIHPSAPKKSYSLTQLEHQATASG
jgi:hypothetical protein